MNPERLLEQLNPPQKQAVSASMQHLLVLAGAGSGKTRVLVHRIAWLLIAENLPSTAIMAVTFTNKAAGEMRARLEATFGFSIEGMWVGTFHSIAHRLLRLHYREAGLQEGFQILDSEDQLRLIKRLLKSLNLDEEKWPPRQVQWFINGQKDEGKRAGHIDTYNDPYLKGMVKIYSEYEAVCLRTNVVDFAEIILRSHELLLNHPDLLAHYQSRFKALLVDEFQDTNTIQYAWLKLLAGRSASVMIVGDDDQSIYGWRGAKIENIQRFTLDFKNSLTIRLEQNYRSTGNILQAANHLIGHNNARLGKELWTEAGLGEPINVYCAFNELDEARFVCESIRLNQEKNVALSDMAVLYRSNAQSRVIEEALIKSGLPYRIYGGLRFFERAEIKDVMSYLRLMANEYDDGAFERVVNLPTRGIGERTLTMLREKARGEQIPLWQAAISLLEANALTARAHNALKGFLNIVNALKIETSHLALHEIVEQAINHSGLKSFYSKLKGEKAQSKLENIQELVNAAKQYQQEEGLEEQSVLSSFITHATLEAGEKQSADFEDCVQLMTLHSAKGLEFPYVYMVGMEEGLFPSFQSVSEPGRLEEERRLCYVGMTRAQKVLTLSYAEIRRLYGRESYHRPSRFLSELPSESLQEVRLKASFQNQSSINPFKSTARKSTVSQEDKSESGLRLGQRVVHSKFGEGTIVNFEGSGEQARVEVRFTQVGTKWLVLAYAKLQPLNTTGSDV